jgi:hypothetical protein
MTMKTLSAVLLASTVAFASPAYADHRDRHARHGGNVFGEILGQLLEGIADQSDDDYVPAFVPDYPPTVLERDFTARLVAGEEPGHGLVFGDSSRYTRYFGGLIICGKVNVSQTGYQTFLAMITNQPVQPVAYVGPAADRGCAKVGLL